MGKKQGLAGHLGEISRKSDENVLEMIKQLDVQKNSSEKKTKKEPRPVRASVTRAAPVAKSQRSRELDQEVPAQTVQRPQPSVLLNTRISADLDELLDEQLAQQKRHWKRGGHVGLKPTKQGIVQKALEAYLSPK